MILLVDNYDSFTFNLYQSMSALGAEVLVRRNDEISLSEVRDLKPKAIVISPGPKTPNEAGPCIPLIKNFYQTLPILGICLGHQSIGLAFGGKIKPAKKILHGKTSLITHNESNLFQGIPQNFEATRYHSWSLSEELPTQLKITARSDDGEIMGIEHKEKPLYGLQFHPESILTKQGDKIIKNFIKLATY